MNQNLELLTQIFEVCIIPLLGFAVTRLIAFLNAKRDEAKTKIDSEVAKKYIDMITNTVTRCVITTNQTYVDSLKKQGSFDAEAQKIAFDKTYNAVMAILTEDAKAYIENISGDAQEYIISLIEAEVNKEKA